MPPQRVLTLASNKGRLKPLHRLQTTTKYHFNTHQHRCFRAVDYINHDFY
nr:MAG TPA: hypothetical protein [Caudoviricetes sp.]